MWYPSYPEHKFAASCSPKIGIMIWPKVTIQKFTPAKEYFLEKPLLSVKKTFFPKTKIHSFIGIIKATGKYRLDIF
jgi:hypothetical protein